MQPIVAKNIELFKLIKNARGAICDMDNRFNLLIFRHCVTGLRL